MELRIARALAEICQHLEVSEMGKCLLRHLLDLVGGEEGRLYLRTPGRGRWKVTSEVLKPGIDGGHLPFRPLSRIASPRRQEGTVSPWQESAPPAWKRHGILHLACLPIVREGDRIGLAVIWNRSRGPFSARALRAGGDLADGTAVAVRNAWTVAGYRELIIKDDQTNSYNRRHFEPYLVEETARAKRYGTTLSLIFLDLDNLKKVNTRYGHAMGSRTLRELSERLVSSIRSSDKLFRYGGDEFCILLPETDMEGARDLAERLRVAIAERPFLLAETSGMHLTASFGIASFPIHAGSAQDLVRYADRAMNRIKMGSKNSIAVADPISDREVPEAPERR